MKYATRPTPTEGDGMMADYEAAARFLFALLDDIDTIDDMVRANDAAYRDAVRKVQKRRYEVASTDGYEVTFNDNQAQAGE